MSVLVLTDSTITTCPPNYFLCPDHRCIDNSYVCDGDQDCLDGSDEKDCGRNLCNFALGVLYLIYAYMVFFNPLHRVHLHLVRVCLCQWGPVCEFKL